MALMLKATHSISPIIDSSTLDTTEAYEPISL